MNQTQTANKSVALDVVQISYTEKQFALAEHLLVVERADEQQARAQQRVSINNPCRFLGLRKAA